MPLAAASIISSLPNKQLKKSTVENYVPIWQSCKVSRAHRLLLFIVALKLHKPNEYLLIRGIQNEASRTKSHGQQYIDLSVQSTSDKSKEYMCGCQLNKKHFRQLLSMYNICFFFVYANTIEEHQHWCEYAVLLFRSLNTSIKCARLQLNCRRRRHQSDIQHYHTGPTGVMHLRAVACLDTSVQPKPEHTNGTWAVS